MKHRAKFFGPMPTPMGLAFFGPSSVEAYVKQHGLEKLEELVEHDDLDSESMRYAKAWLETNRKRVERESAAKLDRLAAEQRDLEERNTTAAELSAEAARKSARWSGLAVLISLAALAIAAWPHVSF